jgi:hypothetical protein
VPNFSSSVHNLCRSDAMMLMMMLMMLIRGRLLYCFAHPFCVQSERLVIQSVGKTVPPMLSVCSCNRNRPEVASCVQVLSSPRRTSCVYLL